MDEARAAHLHHLRAQLLELGDRGPEGAEHTRRVGVTLQLTDHADPHAAQVPVGPLQCGSNHRRHGGVDGGGVARVVASDDSVQQRGVQHGPTARPALVQRGGARHQAVARDGAVGGLDADGAGERRRLADGPAGVGPDREGSLEGGQGRGRPTAGATGYPVQRPRVVGRAVGGVLGGRAHRELVHVGLAQHGHTGRAQLRGDRGVVGRGPALEDARPASGGHVHGGEHVLERERDAGQRRGRRGPGGQGLVNRARRSESGLGVDVQERVHPVVDGADAVEVRLGDLDRGHLTPVHEPGELGRG